MSHAVLITAGVVLASLLGLAACELASRWASAYAHESAATRRPAVYVLCALAFGAVAAAYGLTLQTIELLAFTAVLVALSLVDLSQRVIPNECVIAAIVVRVVYLACAVALGAMELPEVGYYLASGLGIGIVLVVVVLSADRVFQRESMGGGDLKLFAVAGFYFGWQQGVLLIMLACIIAVVASAVAARRPRAEAGRAGGESADERFLQRTLPFGPSIAAACVLVMLVGNPVISWYLGFL